MASNAVSPNVGKTALDRIVFNRFEVSKKPGAASVTDPLIFNQIPISRSAQIEEVFHGGGYWDLKGETANVPAGQSKVGNQVTYTVVEYAKSEDISKNLFDDDQHGMVAKLVDRMARNGALTREREGFGRVFVDAFTTNTTHDALSLCNNSHNLFGSGKTQDNLLTAKLNESPLNDAILTLAEMLSEDGVIEHYEPSCLLVPSARFKGATELVESEYQATTANNAVNVFSTKYGIFVKQTPFIGAKNTTGDAGSDNIWFLLADYHEINRYIRQDVMTDLVDYKFQRNNNYIYKASYREVYGSPSWVGVVGSNGTTGTNI